MTPSGPPLGIALRRRCKQDAGGSCVRSVRGFTLVEAVVSLAIVALALAVVSEALMTSNQTDVSSVIMVEGSSHLDRMRFDDAMHIRAKQEETILPGWTMETNVVTTGGKTGLVWNVISLRNVRRPSLEMRESVRQMKTPPKTDSVIDRRFP